MAAGGEMLGRGRCWSGWRHGEELSSIQQRRRRAEQLLARRSGARRGQCCHGADSEAI